VAVPGWDLAWSQWDIDLLIIVNLFDSEGYTDFALEGVQVGLACGYELGEYEANIDMTSASIM
jgi:hypothetical protein